MSFVRPLEAEKMAFSVNFLEKYLEKFSAKIEFCKFLYFSLLRRILNAIYGPDMWWESRGYRVLF